MCQQGLSSSLAAPSPAAPSIAQNCRRWDCFLLPLASPTHNRNHRPPYAFSINQPPRLPRCIAATSVSNAIHDFKCILINIEQGLYWSVWSTAPCQCKRGQICVTTDPLLSRSRAL
ncbi:hypothetical protein BOTBODRAFT_352571 [Botryobasidium botryosum FD-172 SS1]|uniref:Uncharacterized protein n=1 Tax=Botryobasidium botryosum (strain FD-172 SS1) TaxID=930990 RepID=A0A067MEI1_BOTB1|nr:hypothetical protein BOTBODRAFT_352571 [Botryobasidium botryosum FD-172 SS1]